MQFLIRIPVSVRWFSGFIVPLALLLTVAGPAVRADELQADFDARGLSALRARGVDLLADGAPKVTRVVLADRYRDRNSERPARMYAADDRTFTDADLTETGRAFDPKSRTLVLSFEWGNAAIAYQPGPDKLDVTVKVQNRSKQVIELVSLQVMELVLPKEAKPELVNATVRGNHMLSNCNVGGPDLRRAVFPDGQLLWLSTQPNRVMRQRLESGGEDKLILSAIAGDDKGGSEIYEGIWDCRPIKPGKSDTYELSLRFAAADADPYAVAEDVFRAFGKACPQKFTWADRRPIGELQIGDARRDGRNPRGWFFVTNNPAIDAHKPDYNEKVRENMMASVDRTVACARRQGMQGVIVWQIEGMQEPGHSYYGEPRILPYAAPEMDAVADDYFRKLREAGLRVGVCIRPVIQFPFVPDKVPVVSWQQMREAAIRADWSVQFRNYEWVGKIPKEIRDVFEPEEAWDVVARLDHKIAYAKKRWGATIFYLDSNFFSRPRTGSAEGWQLVLNHGPSSTEKGARKAISAEMLCELQRRHPDVLVIAEWQYVQCWSACAQYTGPPAHYETGGDVRIPYPEAMTVFSGPNVRRMAEKAESSINTIINGDTCLVDPVNCSTEEMVKTVFGQAALKAPYQVAVSTGGITVNGLKMASAKALREYLAKQLRGNPPLPERRAFIRYGKDVSAESVQKVIDAIAQANGIIAWSQLDEKL